MKSVQFQIPVNRLAVCVAVSIACHVAYAKSPFAPEPLHLIDVSTTTTKTTAKPNVMLFIDDSGSMRTTVPGTSKSRMQTVVDAITGVVEKYTYGKDANGQIDKSKSDEKMHWNFFTLWSNPRPMSSYTTGKSILPILEKLTADNRSTPTTIRYLDALPDMKKAMKYKCQKNFVVMLSDGDANGGIRGNVRYADGSFAVPGDGSYIDENDRDNQRGGIYAYSDRGRPRIWAHQGYAVPNFRSSSSDYDPLGLGWTLPNKYLANGVKEDQGISYFSRLLAKTDLKTDADGKDVEGSKWDGDQVIETYTVGFGDGISPNGEQYLKSAGIAAAGGQAYFQATSSDELINAFDKIFADINDSKALSGATETTSISTPSNTSSPVANLAATMTLNTKIWGSELQFSEIEQGGLPKKDSSGKYITKPAKYEGRRVIMNNGTDIYSLDKGVVPGYAHDDFGFKNKDEFLNAFLPWLRRDPTETDEEIEKYAATLKDRTVEKYRKRTDSATSPARQMGDVLDASILGVGENPKYVVTGANDGMVYIFRATNGTAEPYELALNYLPGGMERDDPADTLAKKLKNIAESTYTSPKNVHIYGVDGGITYTKTAKTAGRNQRTIALGAMGKGGKGVYALHISGCERSAAVGCSPVGLDAGANSWISTVPAWESEKGKGNTLGYTVGTPRLYQLAKSWDNRSPKIEQNVILGGFVANGFEGKEEPSLYIYDAMGEEMGTSKSASLSNGDEGKLLTKVKVRNDGVIGALASPTLVDVDFDGIVDIAYAGDFDGDMYRFDLRESIGNLSVGKIYDGDPSQPITSAPAVYRNNKDSYIVVFGTGSDLFEKDRTNTDQQVFMGIYDDLSKAPKAATQSNLLKQTLTNEGDKTRIVSNNAFDKSKYSGWVIDLAKGGTSTNSTQNSQVTKTSSSEIVVSTPSILLSTAFFTTRIYATEEQNSGSGNTGNNVETCKASTESEKSDGTSWMMAIDVKNGGMPRVGQSATFREGQYEKKAGFNLNVMASAPNLVSESALKSEPPAVGVNGNVVNGVQQDLTKGKQERNNACLTSDDNFAMVSQAKKDNPLRSVAIKGKLCGGRLIRVNTREIKEF